MLNLAAIICGFQKPVNKGFQAGKLTAGHRFAIIANANFPLKTALVFIL